MSMRLCSKTAKTQEAVHCSVIKSLHFILAQSGNSIIVTACSLKSS